MNAFNSSFFPKLNAAHTFTPSPDLDVLILPGRLGTRSANRNSTLEFIKSTYSKVQYLITICTGSTLVTRIWILSGLPEATNKASWHSVIGRGRNTTWEPEARWVVDGSIWSSSGISAGVDATLAFIAQFCGKEMHGY
ncbi:class I glutamine amidotransferase-like protein [Aspergillus navahoensis]